MGRDIDKREAQVSTEELEHLPDPVASRIRAEQIYSIVRFTPAIMVANICNVVVLVVALRGTTHEASSLVWAFALSALSAYSYLKGVAMRAAPKPSRVSARAIHHAVVFAFAIGAMWCLAPLLFFQQIDANSMVVIVCLCCGMMCAGALVLASTPQAAFAFVAPVLVGSLVAVARSEIDSQQLVSLLFVIYACVLILASLSHYRQMANRLLKQIEAENVARQDALTRLPNLLAFREYFEHALERCSEYGSQAAILYLDLDGFKPINDRYGHAAGDEILVQVAERLDENVRKTDFVARLGGDEFAIALIDVGGPVQVMAFVDRLTKAFGAPFIAAGMAQKVGASIGIALAPSDGLDVTTLIEKADSALYQAKSGGGQSCRFFDPRHAKAVQERRDLEADLRVATEKGEIRLALQPIIDIASGRIVGCEALARWSHPVRGEISPDEFIPMAERTGLIHELGAWIVRDACRIASNFPPDIPVSVNVSVAQLRGEAMVTTLLDAVKEFGLTPDRIEIEITESLLIARNDPAIDIAHRLAKAGFAIALDDFGTGYASLNYLRKLPLSRVKIDREFIRDSIDQADCAAIVVSVVQLARTLDLKVTAEGVENERQLAFLKSVGCGAAQGYFISRPIDEDDMANLFESNRSSNIAA